MRKLWRSRYNENVQYWGCPLYPKCSMMASTYKGDLRSSPADNKTRNLRKMAHGIASKIWGSWDKGLTNRDAMYEWLEANTETGHIGFMEAPELSETITKLKTLNSNTPNYG